ncbi:MAG: mechanosensitive ion channel family protein [Candidatus Zixiibacteriota bacterium]
MEYISNIYEYIREYIPSTVGILLVIIVLYVARLILDKRFADRPGHQFRRQVINVALLFAGLILIVMIAPLSDASRGQLLSLIGILITAAIALSSTTLVGNIMAGLMLRAVRNFRAGDFISVGEHFGRVSERGLFHVEIQNEERDLITLPNLFVASHPVEVLRSSGTIISATVSLGYDIPRAKIKKLLLEAAENAELTEPFVHVMELGDFSVTYRVAGLLGEAKQFLSGRSRLREKMLDVLHDGGVEIVSPTFMNTRPLTSSEKFIPLSDKILTKEPERQAEVESVAFDKADEAESLENLEQMLTDAMAQIDAVDARIKEATSDVKRQQFEAEKGHLKGRCEHLTRLLKLRKKQE